MLSFTGGLKVFVCIEAMDMRKGFEGLHAAVGARLKEDVRSRALFAFTNKKRTRLKVPCFDGTGLWLMTKRLEPERSGDSQPQAAPQGVSAAKQKGAFSWPQPGDAAQTRLELRPEAFAMLTDGIDMRGATLRPWYERA